MHLATENKLELEGSICFIIPTILLTMSHQGRLKFHVSLHPSLQDQLSRLSAIEKKLWRRCAECWLRLEEPIQNQQHFFSKKFKLFLQALRSRNDLPAPPPFSLRSPQRRVFEALPQKHQTEARTNCQKTARFILYAQPDEAPSATMYTILFEQYVDRRKRTDSFFMNGNDHDKGLAPSGEEATDVPDFCLPEKERKRFDSLSTVQRSTLRSHCTSSALNLMKSGKTIKNPIGFYTTVFREYFLDSQDSRNEEPTKDGDCSFGTSPDYRMVDRPLKISRTERRLSGESSNTASGLEERVMDVAEPLSPLRPKRKISPDIAGKNVVSPETKRAKIRGSELNYANLCLFNDKPNEATRLNEESESPNRVAGTGRTQVAGSSQSYEEKYKELSRRYEKLQKHNEALEFEQRDTIELQAKVEWLEERHNTYLESHNRMEASLHSLSQQLHKERQQNIKLEGLLRKEQEVARSLRATLTDASLL